LAVNPLFAALKDQPLQVERLEVYIETYVGDWPDAGLFQCES